MRTAHASRMALRTVVFDSIRPCSLLPASPCAPAPHLCTAPRPRSPGRSRPAPLQNEGDSLERRRFGDETRHKRAYLLRFVRAGAGQRWVAMSDTVGPLCQPLPRRTETTPLSPTTRKLFRLLPPTIAAAGPGLPRSVSTPPISNDLTSIVPFK